MNVTIAPLLSLPPVGRRPGDGARQLHLLQGAALQHREQAAMFGVGGVRVRQDVSRPGCDCHCRAAADLGR